MDEITKLKQINDENARIEMQGMEHLQLLSAATDTQETIVRSFSLLTDFLSRQVTRTEVVNQLTEIGTPDAYRVADAVESMHKTLQTHENTDLTEITEVMRDVLDQVSQLPKDHKDIVIPEPIKPIDYSDQLKSLDTALDAVENAIKSLDLKVDVKAPIVNVPEAKVHVDAPDLKPLSKDIASVEKAIKALVFPTADLSKLEKEQKKQTKILAEILDKPVSSGGGAGVIPFQTSTGDVSRVTLSNGALPMADVPLAKKIVAASPYTYIATALPGTTQASASWQAQRIDESVAGTTVITWADGNANYDNVATNLAGLSYS